MGETSDGSPSAARGAPNGTGDTDEAAGSTSLLARLFGRSEAETPKLNGNAPAAGPVGDRARQLALGLDQMRRMRVEDVAVPRADIVAIPVDAGLADVVAVFRESQLTRLPVYGETLDDPLGFLHLKDLALRCGFSADPPACFEVGPMLRRMLYVPPSMPTGTLLQRMQTSRIHMALVIDEHGGVDGLVTIEDLLEQIVGDIEDEHDEIEAAPWREETAGVFTAQARAELDDFEAATGIDLRLHEADEDVDTLGGLVFRLSGRVPERGEVIAHPGGHEFEVIDADARRIKRLRLRLDRGGPAVLDRAAE
ncbi:MAG: hemolysin family protein [Pseudomonadota bacterium]